MSAASGSAAQFRAGAYCRRTAICVRRRSAYRHQVAAQARSRVIVIASWTPTGFARPAGPAACLSEHAWRKPWRPVDRLVGVDAGDAPGRAVALAVLPLEHGFETDEAAVIAEQDILGDRLVRRTAAQAQGRRRSSPRRRRWRKATSWCTPSTASAGSRACRRSRRLGAPHDCLELTLCRVARKLFLPVENIELLSRYGSDTDRGRSSTGSAATGWQARKARLKQRLQAIWRPR